MKKIESHKLALVNGGRPRWLSGILCLASLAEFGISVASVVGIAGAYVGAVGYITFCNDYLNG